MTFENYCETHSRLIDRIVGRFRETALTDRSDFRQVSLVKLWYLFQTKPDANASYVAACLYRAVLRFRKSANKRECICTRKEEVYDEIPLWEILPDLSKDELALVNFM